MKALFITTADLFDKQGNGGVKASLEHLNMVWKYFGKENVDVCVFVQNTDDVQQDSKIDARIHCIKRTEGNVKLTLAACLGCRVYMPWEEGKIFEYIDSVNPDLLFLDFSILGRIIRRKVKYRTVVFFHNIEADYTYNKVKNEGFFYWPAFLAAKRNDRWATLADRVLCFNLRDGRRLEELYGRTPDLYIPITLSDEFCEGKTIDTYGDKRLLFLGSLFGPNQEGIEWFMQNVMPKMEGVTLDIVGKGFESKKIEYEKKYDNVRVIGTVNNPSDYYYSHQAVVMPIHYGAGMKVKTAEAMMYGRHIFASDEALEGYEVDKVVGVDRCNSAEEYVASISAYFESGICKRFEQDVRNLFVDKYESGVVFGKFKKMLDELLL